MLLHGILMSSWAFRHALESLSADLRPIAICLPGHGWSSRGPGDYSIGGLARVVAKVLDQLGIEQADFVGNSLGGAVALRLALDSPERVRRLVLIAPAAVPLGAIGPLLWLQGAHLGPLYRTLFTQSLFAGILRRFAYQQPVVDDAYLSVVWGRLASGDGWVAAAKIARQLQRDMRGLHAELPKVLKRSLVVWGEQDGIIDARFAPLVAARMGRARPHIFANCAHCPMEEHPEAFLELLEGFLREA